MTEAAAKKTETEDKDKGKTAESKAPGKEDNSKLPDPPTLNDRLNDIAADVLRDYEDDADRAAVLQSITDAQLKLQELNS